MTAARRSLGLTEGDPPPTGIKKTQIRLHTCSHLVHALCGVNTHRYTQIHTDTHKHTQTSQIHAHRYTHRYTHSRAVEQFFDMDFQYWYSLKQVSRRSKEADEQLLNTPNKISEFLVKRITNNINIRVYDSRPCVCRLQMQSSIIDHFLHHHTLKTKKTFFHYYTDEDMSELE